MQIRLERESPAQEENIRTVVRFERLKDKNFGDEFRKKVIGRVVGAQADKIWEVGK